MRKIDVLYKYASAETALKILESGQLAVNKPDNFNDPYDTLPTIRPKDMNNAVSLAEEFAFEGELKNFAKTIVQSSVKEKSKIPWKIVLKEMKFFDELCIKSKAYTSSGFLKRFMHSLKALRFFHVISNEQYSKLTKLWQGVLEQETKSKEEIDKIIQTSRNRLFVTCFSRNNKSLRMWSYYSDHHKGACIEYSGPFSDSFYPIRYSKKLPCFNVHLIAQATFASQLAKKDFFPKKVSDNFVIPFMTKSQEWSYEEEVRFAESANNISPREENGKFLIPFRYRIIAIYLGAKISRKDSDAIRKKAQALGIKTIQMSISKEKYSLEESKKENPTWK